MYLSRYLNLKHYTCFMIKTYLSISIYYYRSNFDKVLQDS
jgi:hypothetical protein